MTHDSKRRTNLENSNLTPYQPQDLIDKFKSKLYYMSSSSSTIRNHMPAPVMRYTQDKSDFAEWDAGSVNNYPWLFIGSLSAVESHDKLKINNITRILTVARRLPIQAPLPDFIVDHCIVEIDDHPRANFLDAAAHKCREFIDTALSDYESYIADSNGNSFVEGNKMDDNNASKDENVIAKRPPPSILVHCASGVSRSATAILTWLMDPKRLEERESNLVTQVSSATGEGTQIMSLKEALTFVRKNRPAVNPNIGFMMQLQVLEKHGGDLQKAKQEWNANQKVEIYELVSTRRQKANEIHAKVDELEVKIQTFRSSKSNEENKNSTKKTHVDNNKKLSVNSESSSYTLNELLRELEKLSDELDIQCNGDSECSLPEDRVTKMIFKSARRKIEQLFSVLTT